MQIYQQASALYSLSSHLRGFIDDSLHHWQGLEFFGGAGEAARTALSRTTALLESPAAQMRAAAAVLAAYAPLQERIEHLIAALQATEGTPAARQASHALNALDALGNSLDWACARQLEALCTPEMATPPERLEDFSALSLPELHQVQLSTAPAEVQRLAEENPDLTLLEVSPGRLVALVDPQHLGTQAAQVTTFVGGVGSAHPSSWPTGIERARAAALATGGPAVAWMGYGAPESLARATHERPAEQGAAELRRFQRALGQRFPGSQRIVVGYSYGSVVVGKAARGTVIGDDVVFVGSPGTSARSAAEIPGRVWAATNDGDAISLSTGAHGGVHGPDPTQPEFGAQPVPGADGLPGNHNSYWKDPAFLRGLGRIAALH
ncbi:alpha/beta hydrolase [Corynebacterium sp.]|uniref:alpha/beta hydrolase n=1 Tax=Corynebacterium sp. TaxID=1720 RepID=UPI0026DC6741|nr:alpha/beta hydrolase [Corynebacterium sp.]MDO5032753.1 alpha/beta hydrolase [Corynebacterium sp.]